MSKRPLRIQSTEFEMLITKLEEIKVVIETFEEFLREYKELLERLLKVLSEEVKEEQ
jgi:hypothetical protein